MSLARHDRRLRIIDNPNKTTPCGMNIGIRAARGRYVAIMGAHNRYALDYLVRGMDVLEQTKADNVGGVMICEAKFYIQEAIAAAHHSPFSVGGARWHNIEYEGPADTVFGGVYRRDVFERIGMFDEELVRNQDDDLNLRLVRAGGKIWQSPSIKSWYQPRGSLKALFGQYVQYGYWKVRVIQKHRIPVSVRHVIPGLFVLSLILLGALSALWWAAVWILAVIVGLYWTCNITASLLTARRKGWKLIPILPLVFLCYHLGYGYGFLWGIYDFVLLRHMGRPSFTRLTRGSPGDLRS
jgi:GT2 family glycosyltransferase